MKVLVTGGAGFIGSAVVHRLMKEPDVSVVTVDKLTYAGSLENLSGVLTDDRHTFRKIDICDGDAMATVFADTRPDAVLHLAAETHVDRSISLAAPFIQTNVVGTHHLLEAASGYLKSRAADERIAFRFIHVSTDEVFGALALDDPPFSETTPYAPRSPYAASKAAADHLVRAWVNTYGLPAIITNCSNNFGPRQFPEKLIPVVVNSALAGAPIPVYGQGANVRDWLYVDDHAEALWQVLRRGRVGQTYGIGGGTEIDNLALVKHICTILDDLRPLATGKSYAEQIAFIADRPGHDLRYAMDCSKIRAELGWHPAASFNSALRETVNWFLAKRDGVNTGAAAVEKRLK